MDRKKRLTIDEVWLAYQASDRRSPQMHARLVLCYAPIVRYIVTRLATPNEIKDHALLAVGFVALSRAIATHDGLDPEFRQGIVALVRNAIVARIAEAN